MVPSINDIRTATLTAKLKRFVEEVHSGPEKSGVFEEYVVKETNFEFAASLGWGIRVTNTATKKSVVVDPQDATVDEVYRVIASLLT